MQNVYTVAQVNAYIKNMFTQDFMMQSIFVKGEVSNCKYHSSGHIYFTLKDEKGQIACVMFAGNRAGLKFRMEEGQQIVVFGTIDVYERDGKYQMYARQIALDGAGVLYERFERLKEELEEQGMFAAEYKQPIPRYIKRLGVVTAPTGAAVQDIINISCRRNPYVQIILYPAIVQGDQAVQSIVEGIHTLERTGVDVMIVGRGGGSIEDLWAFNEREVAQAVFDCCVPIISAVGHETDTTIIDYVADLRAPTPSAAAELAVYDVRQLLLDLDDKQDRIDRAMEGKLQSVKALFRQFELELKVLEPTHQIEEKKQYFNSLFHRLNQSMEQALLCRKHQMEIYIEMLKGLSPLDKLKQGYSYATGKDGSGLHHVRQVKESDEIGIYLQDGRVTARVSKVEEIDLTQEFCKGKESGYGRE
ncbi:MAG: exodeoxyribonuclease VII large subunit [Lachnospiraceae bacterium]|nr:exodeoxyribonuclease VII large subunit [Lachnospiraceae bacterium]